MKIAKLNLKGYLMACIVTILTACGGGGSGGSSTSSGGGTQSYGTLTVGTAAPLSVKSAVSNYIIPLYNNSEYPVILGASISSTVKDVSFDLGACSGKTLNAGDECSITASYNGAEPAAGIQHAVGKLNIAKSGTNGSSSSINVILDYETLPSNYNGVFLAQSLSPILLQGGSAYTTLWLFNGSNANIAYDQAAQFSALPTLGSGSWTEVSNSCGTTLQSGSGCNVMYKYSTNQSTIKNFLSLNNIKILPPIASAKISANLTGYNVYSDLSIQASPQNGTSLINLSTINMSAESYQILIVNAGDLPINSLNASIIGTGFTVDNGNCQAQLPLAPGSDMCYLTITKNNPQGAASLNISYADDIESHTTSAPINYGSLSLNPGSWIISALQGESASITITLTNNGTLPLTYVENTQSGLQDISVDDSQCLNKNLGSCTIKLTYLPQSSTEDGHGTIIFKAGAQLVTLPISYSSSSGSVANLEFCSDSACNTPIVANDIAAQVGNSANHLLYVKNTGHAIAHELSLGISPLVSGLTIESSTCGSSLASDSICHFVLNFSPIAVNNGQTSLTAGYVGGSSALLVNYNATESSFANVVYCDDASCTTHITSLNFNAAVQGTQSQTVYVKNEGTESATGATYEFINPVTDVTVSSNTCGTTLPNNSSACSITIAFNPTHTESGIVTFATKYTDSTGDKESDLTVNYHSSSTPATFGILYYHATFANTSGHAVVSSFVDDPLVLTNKYNPLILSNYIGGILVSYLLDNDPTYPTLKDHYNQDYIIGTIFSQLMQEDGPEVAADFPAGNGNIVKPNRDVMGAGQGGPWQINGYLYKQIGADQSTGLINYIALQKILGYSVDTTTQSATPVMFNNLYYGPILVAYELEQYFAGQLISTSGAGSVPPITTECLQNLSSQSPDASPFDIIMKTLYNAGQTSIYSTSIENDCTSLSNQAFSDKYDTYDAATRLNNDSFAWYPFQTRLYNDELYNNVPSALVPGSSVSPSGANNNHIYFTLNDVAPIFASAFESLGYMTDPHDSATFHYITYLVALNAFNQSVAKLNLQNDTVLDLGNKDQRIQFYTVVKNSIQNIVNHTGANLLATTSSDIGSCPTSIQCFAGFESADYRTGNLVSFPVNNHTSNQIYQCLQSGWCDQPAYDPRESGVTYGAWKNYVLDKQCTNPCSSSR